MLSFHHLNLGRSKPGSTRNETSSYGVQTQQSNLGWLISRTTKEKHGKAMTEIMGNGALRRSNQGACERPSTTDRRRQGRPQQGLQGPAFDPLVAVSVGVSPNAATWVHHGATHPAKTRMPLIELPPLQSSMHVPTVAGLTRCSGSKQRRLEMHLPTAVAGN